MDKPRDDDPRYREAYIGTGQVHDHHLEPPGPEHRYCAIDLVEKVVFLSDNEIGELLWDLIGIGPQERLFAVGALLKSDAAFVPPGHSPGLAQLRYRPFQRDTGVVMSAEPDRPESVTLVPVEDIRREYRDPEIVGQVEDLEAHALFLHCSIHGSSIRRIEAAPVHRGFQELMIPPDRYRVAFDELEKSLHDGFFEAVPGSHSVTAPLTDVASPFHGIGIVGIGARDEPPASMRKRPGGRPIDGACVIVRIGHVRSFPPSGARPRAPGIGAR